ncbi:MAG TPA: hypothetical protein VK932_15560, partial [Kofleriaceae bacterium]|nr:hypothetical protein [Kofleriaceae bacterium]
ATIGALRETDAGGVRELARRLAPPARRARLLVPAVRLDPGELLEGRAFAIERTPASAFTIAPAPAAR